MDISPSADIPSLLKFQSPFNPVPDVLKREAQRGRRPVAPSPAGEAAGERILPDRELQDYFPKEYGGKVSSGKIATSDHERIEREVARDPERNRLYKASREFQAIFVNMMLKSMRSTLHRKDELFYAGNQQDIFEDMLYNEYSKEMSKSPGFNLADEIYNQLSVRLPPLKKESESGLEKSGEENEAGSQMKRVAPDSATRGKARESYENNLPPAGSVPTGKLQHEWDWNP